MPPVWSFNVANSPSNSSPPDRLGWVSSPNQRGTMDIIWPCVSTAALCLWSMAHLNVPSPSDTATTILVRKFRWLLLGILAPELVMMFAFAQMTSAHQSVEDMKALGYKHWTAAHGFYADSGGFRLHIAGYGKPFPITAKQLAYLVEHNLLDMPSITEHEINDRSKADGTAKALTFIQSGWFMTKLIGRVVQGLAVTPLELATSGLLLCSLTTLWFWWRKPLDTQTPTAVHAKQDIVTILLNAGDAAKVPFRDTPLDFVEPIVYWSSKFNPALLRFILRWGLQERPLERIPNDRDYHPRNFKQNLYLAFPVACFSSIHLLGWNLALPTSTECTLWRVSVLIMEVSLSIHGVSEVVGFWRSGYKVGSMELWGEYKKRRSWSWIFIGLGLVNFLSRIFLLTEAVISLRALPEAAFLEVSWCQFLPRL
ncbi:hypothetical protein B0H66DRAFT_582013 [Apodospora peruviana]|uniref:Uncharacterized protein n=1 Tax=Apodospora peruviana TaxID=516989 RepID=A0AAE0I465_9PEZI|nr:hypothetical protein B0H66DRAFT_582013 [Apodospora peruviana]